MANELTETTTDDKEIILTALKETLYPGAKEQSIHMVLNYCRAAKLDPLQKPVHIVPMSVYNSATKNYEWRDTIMPGIGHYRIQASRSGKHSGTSAPDYGPEITETLGGVKITYPKWCRVTVYKLVEGRECAFTGEVIWKEAYATKGKDSIAPNLMWFKRPCGQIAKCAEAQALRMAFPELGAQPTAEEMEGKIIGEEDYKERFSSRENKEYTSKADALADKLAEDIEEIAEQENEDIKETQSIEKPSPEVINETMRRLEKMGISRKKILEHFSLSSPNDITSENLKQIFEMGKRLKEQGGEAHA